MAYRNGNYAAFYVDGPFDYGNLAAHATKDFRYYNLLRAWKSKDSSFPFIDSHGKNYNVRDGSGWDETLKPRIRERLRNSTNVMLFLSSITRNSRAIREEVDYGINTLGLPVIVVYPEFRERSEVIVCRTKKIRKKVRDLWDALPRFRDSMEEVPTIHIPNRKSLIRTALNNRKFRVQTKADPDLFFFRC